MTVAHVMDQLPYHSCMGIFQKVAAKTEQKTISNVLELLAQTNALDTFGPIKLPCHIIDEIHTGFYFRTSDDEVLALFRCQLNWWVYRIDGAKLEMAKSFSNGSNFIRAGFIEPDKFCLFGDTDYLVILLYSEKIKCSRRDIVNFLTCFGPDGDLLQEFADNAIRVAGNDAATLMTNKPPVHNIGSKYAQKRDPENTFEKAFLMLIVKYAGDRDSDSVTLQDVIDYWDKGHVDRELVLAKWNAASQFLSARFMQSKEWSSEDEMFAASVKWLKSNFPKFGLASKEGFEIGDQDRPLPIELAKRIDAFIGDNYAFHQKKARKMTSFNAYLRACVAAELL